MKTTNKKAAVYLYRSTMPIRFILNPRRLKTSVVSFILFLLCESLPAQWQYVSRPGGEITAIALSPKDNNIIYAGQIPDGLVKSEDGGITWQRISGDSTDFRNDLITYIFEHPINGYLYVVAWPKGFFESQNGGNTWRMLHNSPLSAEVDPRREGVFYINPATTLASFDGGRSWSRIFSSELRDAAFPAGSLLTFLGLRISIQDKERIQRSLDGGKTWENVSVPDLGEISAITVAARKPNRLVIIVADDLYISEDAGNSWVIAGFGIKNDYAAPKFAYGELKIAQEDPDLAYVIAGSALYVSKDGGRFWKKFDNLAQPVHHFATDTSGTHIVASSGRQDSQSGIFKSTDSGMTWQYFPINIDEEIPPVINFIEASQYEAGKRLYIDKYFHKKIPKSFPWRKGRALLTTFDAGATWHQLYNIEEYRSAKFMAAHPSDLSSVYVYVAREMYGDTGWLARIQFSDYGVLELETLRTIRYFAHLEISPSNPNVLYLADSPEGYERSDDAGRNWVKQNSEWWGSPKIHPENPALLFSHYTKTLLEHFGERNEYIDLIARSTNAGVNWEILFKREYIGPNQRPWRPLVKIVLAPNHTDTFYALFGDSLRYTTDLGKTWRILLADTLGGFRDVAVDFKSNIIYLLKDEKDILISKDHGLNWQIISVGLEVSHINNMSLSPAGELFIAADKGMLYYSPSIVDVEERQELLPNLFSLEQNYPNPFNSNTTIHYTLQQRTFVELKIYDVLGRIMDILVSEIQDAGYYQIQFEAKDLASGIYFCRLEARGFLTTTKKIILLK